MLSTLPLYLAFLATSVGLVALGLFLYVRITPYRELVLIRQGNVAAAISLGGTAIGLSIALFSIASGTHDLLELAAWGGVALVSQLVVFVLVSLVLPGFRQGIEEGRLSYGIVLGAFSIAMGLLNAGSLSS